MNAKDKDTLQGVKFLTARRAYEFQQDALRLSALCTPVVGERLQRLFQFRQAIVGTPMPTFGEVPAVFPAGYVFDIGIWGPPTGEIVPIRFMHIEPRRIVIDVAGKSDTIGEIYSLVIEALADLRVPDEAPLIGESTRSLDYSEITLQDGWALDALVPAPVHSVMKKYSSGAPEHVLVPVLSAQVVQVDQEYPGESQANDSRRYSLALRAGTAPQEHVWFSAAPLDTETHLHYLRELMSVLRSKNS